MQYATIIFSGAPFAALPEDRRPRDSLLPFKETIDPAPQWSNRWLQSLGWWKVMGTTLAQTGHFVALFHRRKRESVSKQISMNIDELRESSTQCAIKAQGMYRGDMGWSPGTTRPPGVLSGG